MLKNKHLTKNMRNHTQTIFLKFCYISILLLFMACKSEPAKKEVNPEVNKVNSDVDTSINSVTKRIVFFGDSLTAGYGLDDVENAFPGLIQMKIDSLGLNYTIVNSGISGETSAGGKNRINWVLNQKPDIFVLELGANDGLRGVNLSATKKNLQYIIDAVKTKYPNCKIVLTGMQIPPNLGQEYTAEFRNIFPSLANKNKVSLIPFLLKNVGGIPALNQSDGIHPTKQGHTILAKNVWDILAPLLD